MSGTLPLRVVHVDDLPGTVRDLLCPAPGFVAADGREIPRPRHFYEVDSWDTALHTDLAAHFALWEFMDVDVREAAPLRSFPRYVPCAVSLLAAHLEVFRLQVGSPVRIAANGGYRSPSLEGSDPGSPHAWGSAVNVYRIGEDLMTERETVERYAAVLQRVLPGAWCRPYGEEPGETLDHLHIDLGYIVSVPRG